MKNQKLGRLLALIVGLSIPFNNLAFYWFGRDWSIGFISVFLYTLYVIPFIGNFHMLGKVYGNFIHYPIAFWFVLTVSNFLNPVEARFSVPILDIRIFLCIVYYYLMLLHGIKDTRALFYSVYGMAGGCILMSVLFLAGIGIEMRVLDGRMIMFGENANVLGIYMSIGGIIILHDWILKDVFNLHFWRFAFIITFIPIAMLLLATGSRTAFLIFLLASVTILAIYPFKRRVLNVLALAAGASVLFFNFNNLISDTDIIVIQRLIETEETGNMSGRDLIWEGLLPHVWDNPVIGVGETGYVTISQNVLGEQRSPHNVIIEVLLYTGFIGLIIIGPFWWKSFKSTWRIFKTYMYLLPLVLYIPIVASILSGQLLHEKWAFLLFAWSLTTEYAFKIDNKSNSNVYERD